MKNSPILEITLPEVEIITKETFNDGIVTIKNYNYENSHLIYMSRDLGSFKHLALQQEENINLKQALNKIKEIIQQSKAMDFQKDKYILQTIYKVLESERKEK